MLPVSSQARTSLADHSVKPHPVEMRATVEEGCGVDDAGTVLVRPDGEMPVTLTRSGAARELSITWELTMIQLTTSSVCRPGLSGGSGDTQSKVPDPDGWQVVVGSSTRLLST